MAYEQNSPDAHPSDRLPQGAVAPDKTLKLWVCGDSQVSDSRLKDVAFQVRAFVRLVVGLPADVDPVERTDGGYRLAIGWPGERGGWSV